MLETKGDVKTATMPEEPKDDIKTSAAAAPAAPATTSSSATATTWVSTKTYTAYERMRDEREAWKCLKQGHLERFLPIFERTKAGGLRTDIADLWTRRVIDIKRQRLFKCVRQADLDGLKQLLDDKQVDIKEPTGSELMEQTIQYGNTFAHVAVLDELLRRGVSTEPKASRFQHWKWPLNMACSRRTSAVAQAILARLLRSGIDSFRMDTHGFYICESLSFRHGQRQLFGRKKPAFCAVFVAHQIQECKLPLPHGVVQLVCYLAQDATDTFEWVPDSDECYGVRKVNSDRSRLSMHGL